MNVARAETFTPGWQPEPIPDVVELDLFERQKEPVDYKDLLELKYWCIAHHVSLHALSLPPLLIKEDKTYIIPKDQARNQACRSGLSVKVFSRQERDVLFSRLSRSDFRSSFKLKEKERAYIESKGMERICSHVFDFMQKRLAPALPKNDGKQTPMRGHPVFAAAHATATCCRGCLEKWHHIPRGRKLGMDEQNEIALIQMAWIESQLKK